MARILFVVPPLTGHINPTVAVGEQLRQRGHRVSWVGHPSAVKPLLPEGAELIALDDEMPERLFAELRSRSERVRGLESLKFLWEDVLVPLARAMLPAVEEAAKSFDLLVVDQQALAGSLAARRLKKTWVTSATTSAGILENPVGALSKVWDWVLEQMAELEREAGLSPIPRPDLSPHCVLAFSTRELVGDEAFPEHFAFVGPSIATNRPPVEFPWEALGDEPKILVSLGTVSAERSQRYYQVIKEALAGGPWQVIVAGPAELLDPIPDNFIVQSYLPQLELLPKMQLVICHAGHNTVCESLAHGVPLLVTPIRDDQPVVASQVVAAGAGLRLKFARLAAADVRDAVTRLLNDDSFKRAAVRIGESFSRAGGAERAASVLEALL